MTIKEIDKTWESEDFIQINTFSPRSENRSNSLGVVGVSGGGTVTVVGAVGVSGGGIVTVVGVVGVSGGGTDTVVGTVGVSGGGTINGGIVKSKLSILPKT